MCTSITLKSSDGLHMLARTMDFSVELDVEMAVFPRNYEMTFAYKKAPLVEHYAFMGLSKDIGERFVADGVNEKGLAGMALYFAGYAHYQDATEATSEACLTPIEVLMYALATCANVDEAVAMMQSHQIIEQKVAFIGTVPPLHWVFADQTGASVILEVTETGLQIHDNKLGILTNSPDYGWHLTNLRNYIGLHQTQNESRIIYGEEFKPFGQASGTFGLPGDYTPPSRFVRALYSKLSLQAVTGEHDLVVGASHVLNAVDIPKGAVVAAHGALDYTQYTSYLCLNTQNYYYRLYQALEVTKVSLSDFDLEGTELMIV